MERYNGWVSALHPRCRATVAERYSTLAFNDFNPGSTPGLGGSERKFILRVGRDDRIKGHSIDSRFHF
jgi:hypothetical protein